MKFFFFLLLSAAFTLNAETIEELIGSKLLVHFNGMAANEESQRLIDECHVRGFIFFGWANGLTDREQVKELTRSLQAQSPRKLLFAVDQEGGRVARLREDFTVPPANSAVESPEEAYAWASKVGKELQEAGINMNLAPVVDVNSNPNNPVIGDRSYSDDPARVVEMARAALRGYEESGVIAVLKHFPGHGDTEVDSHLGMPIITKSLEQLQKMELLPFRELAKEAPAIMTSHLLVSALDAERCVTLSPVVVRELLIGEIGFKGMIMTDSLVMQGVQGNSSSVEEAALEALRAGHNLLVLGGRQLNGTESGRELNVEDVVQIHRFLCAAVEDGRLPLQSISR